MKKLFIAVLTAGVCFGVTNVEAKSENKLVHWSCQEIVQNVRAELLNRQGVQGLIKKIGLPRTQKDFDEYNSYSAEIAENLRDASHFATIYTAFCK